MKTIAVTGATSMIGVALIKKCIQNNIAVFAFVRSGSHNMERLPCSSLIRILECDLREMESFNVSNKYSADVFIHLGWDFTDKTGRNDCQKQLKNVQYTLDAVHLAKRLGCKRFIGAGSQAEYGTPNKLLKSDTPVCPLIPYGVAKYTAGRLSAMEWQNIRLLHKVIELTCAELGKDPAEVEKTIVHVKDRPGHDMRYAIDCTKIKTELGWTRKVTFEEGLKHTVQWNLSHREWLDHILSGEYTKWITKNYRERQENIK